MEFASKAAAAAALRLSEPQLGGRTLRLTFLKQPKAAPAAASAAMGEGAGAAELAQSVVASTLSSHPHAY